MSKRKLDSKTLRSVVRRLRLNAKGPRRNYDSLKPPRAGRDTMDTIIGFRDGEHRGYWRGWFCALQQIADELLEDARSLESATRKKAAK